MILFLIAFGFGVINFSICSVVSRANIMRYERTTEMSFVAGVAIDNENLEPASAQ